jgi:hypothetical protein
VALGTVVDGIGVNRGVDDMRLDLGVIEELGVDLAVAAIPSQESSPCQSFKHHLPDPRSGGRPRTDRIVRRAMLGQRIPTRSATVRWFSTALLQRARKSSSRLPAEWSFGLKPWHYETF